MMRLVGAALLGGLWLGAEAIGLGGAGAAQAQTLLATGSGFLVNDTGWVLTNAHVVEDCDWMEEASLGRAVSVIEDSATDLAVVLFRGERAGAPLLIRKDPPRLTEAVTALGFPLSDLLGTSIRATTGTVSARTGLGDDPTYFQMSAPIQAGNSGGPVLDAAGHVIGVTTATVSAEAYEGAQNVNFAITAREVGRFLRANGIAFARAEEGTDGSGGLSVEDAAASTYLLRCMGETGAPGSAAPPALAMAPGAGDGGGVAGMISYDGMDVLGFDYRTLRDVSLDGCEAACGSDGSCRAYTYNTQYDVCFLKSDAMVLVENTSAVGGYDAALASQVVDSGLVVTADMDSPGGDYQRLRGSDYIACTLACGTDLSCRAFAFVRETGDCWLKDRVGPLQTMAGVEFGMRR